MKRWLGAIAISMAVSPALAENAPSSDPSVPAMFQKSQDLKWEKINPEMGSKSAEIAVLHVNPTTQATEMLIRTPKDTHVPKHWHSANETITIIHGTFIVAHEGESDRVSLDAGSFAYMPARMVHEAWTGPDGEAMYLVTVDGAWDINWVATN
jgi:quercetin dioxygenase-like cupin family protein